MDSRKSQNAISSSDSDKTGSTGGAAGRGVVTMATGGAGTGVVTTTTGGGGGGTVVDGAGGAAVGNKMLTC